MNAHSMPEADISGAGGVAAEELKQFIERIERLEQEKSEIAEQIKEVFAEAKGVLDRIADQYRVSVLLQLLGREVRVFVPAAHVGTA